MKHLFKFTTTVFAFIVSVNAYSQETDILKNYSVSGFTELQSQVSTEVIIIQSTRNNILVQGSKEAQREVSITEEEGRLAIFSNAEKPELNPTRIVIETTGFNSLISGGTGNYYVFGLDQKSFVLMNPEAKVLVSGTLDQIYLTSLSGHTDLSGVNSEREWISLYGKASYIESRFSGRNLLAKKAE